MAGELPSVAGTELSGAASYRETLNFCGKGTSHVRKMMNLGVIKLGT